MGLLVLHRALPLAKIPLISAQSTNYIFKSKFQLPNTFGLLHRAKCPNGMYIMTGNIKLIKFTTKEAIWYNHKAHNLEADSWL